MSNSLRDIMREKFFYFSKEFCKDDVSTSLFLERVRYDIHGHESIASYDDDIS